MGLFDNIKNAFNGNNKKDKYLSGFSNTGERMHDNLNQVYSLIKQNDQEYLELLMETLLSADVGYNTAVKICDNFEQELNGFSFKGKKINDMLYNSFYKVYNPQPIRLKLNDKGPSVYMLTGVNGSGKTTSCAKLAHLFISKGKSVALVAADTFRAGATEQLKQWADRLDIPCIVGEAKEDPSSVLVKGTRYALENNIDILLCDTAGRLQNKVNLMNELSKMKKVLNKNIPGAPHETLLVLDANTGQNGLSQAMEFNEVTKLDGIVLTKLDGTSKGGIILAIKDQLSIPVKFIGLGEGLDDLNVFDLDSFLYSILGEIDE
jgi:fused signal recognition particle receptor